MRHALNAAIGLFFASFVSPTVVIAIDEVKPVRDASVLYVVSLVVVFVIAYAVVWWAPPPGGSLYDVMLLAPFVYLPVVAAFVSTDEPVYRVAIALAGVIAFVPALVATVVGGRLNSRVAEAGGNDKGAEWYARRSPRRRRLMQEASLCMFPVGFAAVLVFGWLSGSTVSAEGVAFAMPFFVFGFVLFASSYTSGIHRANKTGFVVEYPARSRFYEWENVERVVVDEEADALYIDCGVMGVSCDTREFDVDEVADTFEVWIEVEWR